MGCAAGPGPRPASWKHYRGLLVVAKRPALPNITYAVFVYVALFLHCSDVLLVLFTQFASHLIGELSLPTTTCFAHLPNSVY